MYKIGIDVGGTNTDGVLTDYENNIISKIKTYTTKDIFGGINKAIEELLNDSKVDTSLITHAMLGTTQCTNAIVEAKELKEVITIRICGGTTKAIEPFVDWPEKLVDVVNEAYYLVSGGFEYDNQVITQLNLKEIDEILEKHPNSTNFAISCVNSPIDSSHEEEVKQYILDKRDNCNVSISSEIGTLSLLERENATILNSALKDVIKKVTTGFKESLLAHNINTKEIYLCQNDGTIMNLETTLSFPIFTISSGPTNSIRGGVKLTQLSNAYIIDVGGTTTDIGVVVNDLARVTQNTSQIGGVHTNFRMPDVVSIGIGGGTIVKVENDNIIVGPESVGYELVTKALCFGGDVMTLTDIAVKLGKIDLPINDKIEKISTSFAKEVEKIVMEKVIDAIDLLRISDESANIVFVGGGCKILNEEYLQDDNVVIPNNYDVANAIGASIAQVSGSYEGLFALKGKNREEIVQSVIEKAKDKAINSGAIKDSLEVVEVNQVPLSYHPEEAFVISSKVIGNINFE